MSKRDQENREREKREHEEHERPHVRLSGRERQVHLEIVLRWWEGSVPPTPQAYARALKQWRQLPGSIVTSATDIGAAAGTSAPSQPEESH